MKIELRLYYILKEALLLIPGTMRQNGNYVFIYDILYFYYSLDQSFLFYYILYVYLD